MNPQSGNHRRGLAGVIGAMAVVNLVYGITFPLLALVLDGQGVSKTLIGLSTMSQAAAVLLIAPFAPGCAGCAFYSGRAHPQRLVLVSFAVRDRRVECNAVDFQRSADQRIDC